MRTPESVRKAAAQQFAAMVGFEERCERDTTQARADEELGMRIVDAALALPVGELFDTRSLFAADVPTNEYFPKVWRVMPYISGALRLLEIEFANPTVGVVPPAILSELVRTGASVMHEGVELTGSNVYIQYRRRALDE